MQGQNRKILSQHIVMPGIYYQKKLPVEDFTMHEWGVFQQLTFPKTPHKQMGASIQCHFVNKSSAPGMVNLPN